MKLKINLKARLARHARNSHFFMRAGIARAARKYRLFFISVILVIPIYPSFGAFMLENAPSDYDESTILMSYDETSADKSMPDSDFLRPHLSISATRDTSGLNTLISHVVKNGESIGSLAALYGVSANSIIWANNFDRSEVLRVWQVVKVPPVSGVVYRVKDKETIDAIASKFHISASSIFEQNRLNPSSPLQKDQELIIPGWLRIVESKPVVAKKETPKPKKSPVAIKKSQIWAPSSQKIDAPRRSNGFVWGNCTYFVANNKHVTWRGNAKDWLANAAAVGVPTGDDPSVGSIIVFHGRGYNRYYGHVGIVVDIDGDDIIVKDMNFRRINEVTIRRVSSDDAAIKGYIYAD